MNTYATFTQDEIDKHDQWVHDLQVEIKQLHSLIGNAFAKGLINADMIAEALDGQVDFDDSYSLEVIYLSWGGKANRHSDAVEQFSLILQTIRSYQ